VTPPKIDTSPRVESPADYQPNNGHGDLPGPTEPRHIYWIKLLWSERRFLARVSALGLCLATLIAFLLPVRYESTTRLMPPDENSSGLAMLAAFAGKGSSSGAAGALGGSLGSVAGDLLGLKTSGALFMDMLQGPTIQDNIIRRFDLRKVYWDKYWEDARKDLRKHTEVSEDRKSGVITVTVNDHDPGRAQQMAQAYVQALDGLVAQVSTSSARREREFIEQRLKVVKENLDSAAAEFSQFASKNGTLDVPSQTRAMVESEAQLEGNLVAAQSELEGLQQIYTNNNIRVRSLRARVGELKRQIENMSGNKADLTADGSDIAGDFPSIRKLPLVGVEWANLYRETKIQETVYELLTQQYELAKIQEAKEIPTVKVLDPAMMPERKSFPPRTWIVTLGSLFALCLGMAVVLGSATWQHSDSHGKQLATSIWGDLRQQFPVVASRDSRAAVYARRFADRVGWQSGARSNGNRNGHQHTVIPSDEQEQ